MNCEDSLNRWEKLSVIFIVPLLFGFLSLYFGRDVNWDLKNYHYYNAYAFVEHRMDFDIAPAQLQTYINPLSDLPFYFMVKLFHARVAGMVLGFVHGINLSLLFFIFWKITRYPHRIKFLLGICLIFFSALAPMFLSELGNTMQDNLTSLFVLGALLLLITALKSLSHKERFSFIAYVCAAGFVLGFGVGLKPTIIIFALSSALVFTLLLIPSSKRLAAFLLYLVSGAAGAMLSAGFWFWQTWLRFGNPFFPFYNHIFKSPYFTSLPVNWTFYSPRGLWEYLLWPFIFFLDGYRTNPLDFQDIRFALLELLCVVWLIYSVIKKLRLWHHPMDQNRIYTFETGLSNSLLLFFLFSYILWIKESATYRFMIPLELLVPLCSWIILDRLLPSGNFRMSLAVVMIVAVLVSFKPFQWGRLEWTASYFSVDTSHLNTTEDAVVIMLGSSPTSYVIPSFPRNFRFVRPEGNLFDASNFFFRDIKELLKAYNGNIYVLFDKNDEDIKLDKSLSALDLHREIEHCFSLVLNVPDDLQFCHLSDEK